MTLDFPYHIDGTGRTATTDGSDHLRDLIYQVLLTAPGERVMRPDFGSGLLGLVFEPGGPETVASTQYLVQGALQQTLGHLITVDEVEVGQVEGVFNITVRYVVIQTRQSGVAEFAVGTP